MSNETNDPILLRLTQIQKMAGENRSTLEVLTSKVEDIRVDLNDINDVVYGDPRRKTLGLVDTHREMQQLMARWRSIERVGKALTGVLVAIGVPLVVAVFTGGG